MPCEVVSYLVSTSNHNVKPPANALCSVVSYLVSTSNHNWAIWILFIVVLFLISYLHQTTTVLYKRLYWGWLFLISYLHQTTTYRKDKDNVMLLFLISYLHQTTTVRGFLTAAGALFLISYLHQTTTRSDPRYTSRRCFLSRIYIKPQHWLTTAKREEVVSYLVSTSNHNSASLFFSSVRVVSYLVSTSNHNRSLTS